MAQFKASDYPEIRKASEAYDVARGEFQRLERQLNETSTKATNYRDLVNRRNAAKEKMDAALKNYQDLTKKRKAEFDQEQKKISDRKKRKSLENKIKTLNDSRQRAADKGESTTNIDIAIKKAQDELDKIKAGKVKGDEKADKAPGRPDGVPAGAKFSAVTGQWTLGNKKWDKNGKAITTAPQGPSTGDKGTKTKSTGPTGPTLVTGPTGPTLATTITGLS